jgi:hypothetical protein
LKIKPFSLRKISERREENPAGRKIKAAKKEENFCVKLEKKTAAKKIHFQTARFEGISFRRQHRTSMRSLKCHRSAKDRPKPELSTLCQPPSSDKREP